MPLEPSPRMRIARPAGSDAFKRQTYIDMIDRIDNFPGVVVSTSASPPSGLDWAAPQTGMMTLQSDTGRLLRFTGTSWVPVENYGRAYDGGLVPSGAAENVGGSVTSRNYSMTPTLTVTRTCTVRFFIIATLIRNGTQPSAGTSGKTCTLKPLFDGVDVGADISEYFPYDPGTVDQDKKRTFINGVKSNVAPGNHTIGVNIVANSATSIRVFQFQCMAFLSE